jgi:2-hydroxy-4-(methylsulfanyl)butanoate S-methyltransferase
MTPMTETTPPPSTTIDRLLDGIYGSFALYAGMQLDLFTPLAERPMRAEELAQKLGVDAAKLRVLLYSIATTGLLEVDDERFSNSREADHYLVRGRPSFIGGVHELLTDLWTSSLKTAASVRTGQALAKHDFSKMSRAELETFFRGIDAIAKRNTRELLSRFDFSAAKTVLDVGGGSGAFAITLAEHHPHLKATVLELPNVADIAQQFVNESKVQDRVDVVGADAVSENLREKLSARYDVAMMRAFVQVLAPDDARRAIANVAEVLEPGGTLYIVGMGMIDDSRLTPLKPVMFNLVFINVYDAGQAYTEAEHRAWLEAAGLREVERIVRPDGGGIFIARKS